MRAGTCALCLKTRDLRDSHLLPAGVYRVLSAGAPPGQQAPVIVDKDKTAVLSSAQARAHLLCSDCEGRLNAGGEDWILKNCWRSPTRFPLHATLTNATPLFNDKGARVYPGRQVPGVDIDKLTYFALSIFWRASVCDPNFGRIKKHRRLSLGPYKDRLRHYLLGTTGMPNGVVLLVTISTDLDELRNKVVMMPQFFRKEEFHHHYQFAMLGLRFDLLCGGRIPEPVQRVCTTRSGYLYMNKGGDEGLLKTMRIMVNRAEGKGKLAASARTTKRAPRSTSLTDRR